MENFRTCDSILAHIEKCVREQIPLGPNEWMQHAEHLNILRSEPQERLFLLQQEVAKAKLLCVENGHNGVTTKIMIESSDVYLEMLKQKAKLERINETILLAKKHASLADWK